MDNIVKLATYQQWYISSVLICSIVIFSDFPTCNYNLEGRLSGSLVFPITQTPHEQTICPTSWLKGGIVLATVFFNWWLNQPRDSEVKGCVLSCRIPRYMVSTLYRPSLVDTTWGRRENRMLTSPGRQEVYRWGQIVTETSIVHES